MAPQENEPDPQIPMVEEGEGRRGEGRGGMGRKEEGRRASTYSQAWCRMPSILVF